jgi:hypothetical protein
MDNSCIFGGVYDDVAPQERPKYGALNFRKRPVGGSPRFRVGSPAAHGRGVDADDVQLCVFESGHFGVTERMSLIQIAESSDADLLDDYIGAQVQSPCSPSRSSIQHGCAAVR